MTCELHNWHAQHLYCSSCLYTTHSGTGPHPVLLTCPVWQVMMDWLAQLMGLPSKFMFRSGGPGGGVIQGTSSEAVLVALLAAR
jgi:hypothetical protein